MRANYRQEHCSTLLACICMSSERSPACHLVAADLPPAHLSIVPQHSRVLLRPSQLQYHLAILGMFVPADSNTFSTETRMCRLLIRFASDDFSNLCIYYQNLLLPSITDTLMYCPFYQAPGRDVSRGRTPCSRRIFPKHTIPHGVAPTTHAAVPSLPGSQHCGQ